MSDGNDWKYISTKILFKAPSVILIMLIEHLTIKCEMN